MDAENFLVHHKALGISVATFDPTEPEDSAEGLVIPPSATNLRGKAAVQEGDLLARNCFVERNVVRNATEVTVPLWDLVMEDRARRARRSGPSGQ